MGYKILVANWRDIKNPNMGGAEVNFQEIFKRLVRRGHQVTLLCSRHDHTFPEEEYIDGIRIVRRGSRYTFNYTVPFVYKREFSGSSTDIFIEDCSKIPLYAPLYVRHPLFVLIHHLHGRSIYGDTLLPAALYVHAAEHLIRFFYRGVPFVAVSQSTKDELVRKGLRPEDIDIVHNGVDHAVYSPDEPARSTQPLIACVTRLRKYKGVHLLLDAMKLVKTQVPEAQLIIAGSGDYEPKLRLQTQKLGLTDCVEFTGFLTDERKVEVYRKAQVVVNPSLKEGWGLTVIEANACGTPVVAAEVAGLIDSVIDGENGFLYPYSDVAVMSERIVRLLKDHELRKKMSARSLEWARKFTWDNTAGEIERMIERLINQSAGKRNIRQASMSGERN